MCKLASMKRLIWQEVVDSTWTGGRLVEDVEAWAAVEQVGMDNWDVKSGLFFTPGEL